MRAANGRTRLPLATAATSYAQGGRGLLRASPAVPNGWRRGLTAASPRAQSFSSSSSSSICSVTLFVSLSRRSIATSAPRLFAREKGGAKPLTSSRPVLRDDEENDEDDEDEWDGGGEEEGEGEEDGAAASLDRLRAAVEKRQRLSNSKKRDINKKGVTQQGDTGQVPVGGLQLDDADEEELVAEDGDDGGDGDGDGNDETEAELDGTDIDDDDDEGDADRGVAGEKGAPKVKARDRQHVVRKGDADMRLDRWLKLQLPHLPNSLFQKLLRKRKIRVDGAVEKQLMAEEERESEGGEGGQTPAGKRSTKLDGKRHLQPGDVVSYPAYLDTLKLDAKPRIKKEMKPLSEEDTKLAQSWVIYKDNRLIALNKPPGLPVQGGSDVGDNHLGKYLSALKFDKEDVPRLVHRLDKECSGVLIMGRSRADATHFTSLFKNKHVTKQYWAVLAGVPNPRSGRLAVPLKELGHGVGVAQNMQEEGAKMAVTRYETRADATNEVSFVELWPWTGRKHQLRVHCAEVLKAPILGDDKYGSHETFEKFELMLNRIDNLHLHCRSLEIPHPIKEGQRLRIVAAPPPYFRRTMDTFEFSEHDAPLAPPRVKSADGLKKKAQREAKKAEREAKNKSKKTASQAASAAGGGSKKTKRSAGGEQRKKTGTRFGR